MATKEKVILSIKTEAAKAIKDLAKFNKELLASNKSTKNNTKAALKWGAAVAVAALAIRELTQFMGESIQAASDLEETTSKFNITFREVQEEADAMADTLVNAYGLSELAAKDLLSSTGDLLTGFGFTGKAALDMSSQVQTLAADLASFQNLQGGVEQASNALTRGLLGEREMLKTLGIVVREEDVNNELFRKGQERLTGQALLQAKAHATLAIAIRQSGNAIGDVEATFNSFANVQRRIGSRLDDIKAQFGKEMTPALRNLGLAFLAATEDGGVFANILIIVGRAVAKTTAAISIFTDAVNILNKEKVLKANIAEMTNMQRTLRGLVGTFGKGSKEVKDFTKEMNKSLAGFKSNSDKLVATANRMDNSFAIYENQLKKVTSATKKSAFETKQFSNVLERKTKKEVEDAAKALEAKVQLEKDFTAFVSSEQDKRLQKERDTANALKIQFVEDSNERLAIQRVHEENIQIIKDEFREAEQQKSIENFQLFLNDVQTIGNSLAAVFAQSQRNQTLSLNIEQKKRQKAIAKDFDAQIAAAEKAGKDTTQLEKDKKEALGKLDDEFDARSRALVRKQAILGKKIAITQAIMNTAQGATKALAQGGFFGGPFMASVIAALGLTQVNLIRQQPIPEAQEGALIPGSSSGTLLRAGENNKPEAIIPLTDPEASNALGGVGMTINVNIENNFGGEIGPEFAESMDRALTDLDKDSNSTFAEVLRT